MPRFLAVKSAHFFRQIVQREKRRYRTHRNACATIDTFHRIDIEQLGGLVSRLIFFRMDAIYRAGVHTRGVFSADARFSYNVCHCLIFPGIYRYHRPPRKDKLSVANGVPDPQTGERCRRKFLQSRIPSRRPGNTRFLPATKAQPKEMLPIVDKPIIQYGVEEALHSGIQNIIIVTGRGKTAIEDHFDVSFELEYLLENARQEGVAEYRSRHLRHDQRFLYPPEGGHGTGPRRSARA